MKTTTWIEDHARAQQANPVITPDAAYMQIREVINHAICNQPRSLQTAIGPSELGTPCEHCLAAKIAGWRRNDPTTPWLPTIGTAVHAWLEEQFTNHNLTIATATPGKDRYFCEEKVHVGDIGGQPVIGSTDMVDLAARMTVDWKIVGDATLRKVRSKGPSDVYRTQADLYAYGWNQAGIQIDHVAICFLPRNQASLDKTIWWTAQHDPSRAMAALERANRIANTLTQLAEISTQTRDAWITGQPRDPDCLDCARYHDQQPATPAQLLAQPAATQPLEPSNQAGLLMDLTA